MNKIICFGIFFVLSFSLISAQDFELSSLKDLCSQSEKINNEIANTELPSGVPYKNEIFNLYEGEETYIASLVIKENKIESFGCEMNENPTYNIYIKDVQTLKEIIESNAPLKIFNEKKSNGDIQIKGVTAGKKFKQFWINFGLKIAGWFS
ncbi:MAG: hypothetical protein QT05_C0046G0003 [archaeon GW2011_AR13]|nr:MAG: hypothetical protein QT05_C0046G0003 [archaeon GW2011_AR13]HIG95087.1 hypothetical protein [Nanoarchaeota archaeon]HIH63276.1 hypothetical protein [Nanoarchaeota archaeon]HIJ09272.1 hypothetical protein [Nanoarchaeota archaeon]